jgi:hypothetical protein
MIAIEFRLFQRNTLSPTGERLCIDEVSSKGGAFDRAVLQSGFGTGRR